MKTSYLYSLRALSWICVLLTMGMIWVLSAQPAEQSSANSGGLIQIFLDLFDPSFSTLPPEQQLEHIAFWQQLIRHLAHMTVFGVLGTALFAAATAHLLSGVCRWLMSLGGVGLYALSDEVHQLFVPGRTAQWGDIVYDMLGAVIAVLLLLGVERLALWLIHRAKT